MKQKTIDALLSLVKEKGLIEAANESSISPIKLIEKLGLTYKTFDDIEFISYEELNGVGGKIVFDNGYGASVVRHEYSYGGKKGQYELAILDKEGELTYDTPITSDVMGYLSPKDVTEILIQIQDLKN